jgi:hypothetical protein
MAPLAIWTCFRSSEEDTLNFMIGYCLYLGLGDGAKVAPNGGHFF